MTRGLTSTMKCNVKPFHGSVLQAFPLIMKHYLLIILGLITLNDTAALYAGRVN
jgi:hypothetical protein